MPAELSQIDSTIEVVTPENIAFHYQAAGPFRRSVAFGIDLLIRLGILFLVGCVTSLLGVILGGMAVLTYLVAYFLLDWFYGGVFETFMNGQTPGKWIMGVRVLTTRGRPINGMQAVLRNVFRAVDFMPLLSLEMFGLPAPMYMIPTFMVGLVCMACNRRFQRLGDLVCGTMVVIEERQWLTGVARLDDPRAMQLAEYLPADFVVPRTMAQASRWLGTWPSPCCGNSACPGIPATTCSCVPCITGPSSPIGATNRGGMPRVAIRRSGSPRSRRRGC
jgi:uncharacterized RDD family membrane protein YckC